jgi:hypothetical protein
MEAGSIQGESLRCVSGCEYIVLGDATNMDMYLRPSVFHGLHCVVSSISVVYGSHDSYNVLLLVIGSSPESA